MATLTDVEQQRRLMNLCRRLLAQNERLHARIDRLHHIVRHLGSECQALLAKVQRERADRGVEAEASEVMFKTALDLLHELEA